VRNLPVRHAVSGLARRGTAGFRIAPAVACLAALLLVLPAAARFAFAQGTLSAIEADVDQIVRRARPSLLTVVCQRHPMLHYRTGSVRSSHVYSRVGSGVAIGSDEVLTTASVVLEAEKIIVVTENKLQVEAVLVGLDPIHNVALLRVPGLQLPALSFASRSSELGDWVIALGSSYGAAPTQSVGNISYRWREPRLTLLQLTNQVYPGNSGGAALNSRGELIGLVQGELDSPPLPSSASDNDRRPGGVSFIIPLQEVRAVCAQLRREGHVHLGWMGVSTRPGYVNSETQPGLRVPLGAIVESTKPGGPADRVGLKPGDLIVAYDGERVEYPEQLARWVGATPPGTTVQLVWAHKDMRQEGRVRIDESPTTIPTWMRPDSAAAGLAGPAAGAARAADSELRARRTRADLDRARSLQDTVR
jgi:S1-C subfamily serine protease